MKICEFIGIRAFNFRADWCIPCKKMDVSFLKLKKEFPLIDMRSVDIDQEPDLAKKYNIESIPTLLILEGYKELTRVVGVSLIKPLRKIFRDLTNEELW